MNRQRRGRRGSSQQDIGQTHDFGFLHAVSEARYFDTIPVIVVVDGAATDEDIRKDKENTKLAMEADKEILRTGKGTSYVVEINTDGVQDFVQLIKEPVFDEAGSVTGIIALGNDVTEFEFMNRYAILSFLVLYSIGDST